MKKIVVMLCAALMAAFAGSCSKADAGKQGAKAQNGDAPVAFFKAVGIDTRGVALGDTLSLDGRYASVAVDSLQKKKLLDGVFPYLTDEEFPPSLWLIGVKTLGNGYVLAAYKIEAGPSKSVFFVTYDNGGHLRDVIDTQSWHMEHECYDENGKLVDTGGRDEMYLTMSGNVMTLHRSIKFPDYVSRKALWEQNRDYVVTISDEGTFVMGAVKKSGTVAHCSSAKAQETEVYYDLMDFHYYSMADKGLFAHLERYLTSGKVATPDDRSTACYLFFNMVLSRSKQLFAYMCAHKHSAIWQWLENSVLGGQLPKNMLYDAIQALPEGADKDYLNEATAQWSVEGAVG